jgi:hypothetical protein
MLYFRQGDYPMLNFEELHKLENDLKIFARLHKLVRDESNDEKRKFISLIVEDLFTRFMEDLEEMKERTNGKI